MQVLCLSPYTVTSGRSEEVCIFETQGCAARSSQKQILRFEKVLESNAGKREGSSLGRRQTLVSTSLPTKAFPPGRSERLPSQLQVVPVVPRTPGQQLSCAVTCARVGFLVMLWLLGHPCSCPSPLTVFLLVTLKLDFDAIVTLDRCGFRSPSGTSLCIASGKACHTTARRMVMQSLQTLPGPGTLLSS